MKPVAPTVPLPLWKQLYSVADRVQDLRPWEHLDDLDLVVVRDQPGGQTGYGAFMGSGGSLFGYCAYRGAEGFEVYKGLISGKISATADDYISILNCLKLEFGPRNDLQPDDHAVIKTLGLSFRGKHSWPEFRSMIPGHPPWFLTEAEVVFLTLNLHAACYHSERIVRGEIDESFREGECLVYTPNQGSPGFVAGWEPWPEPAKRAEATPLLNLTAINAIRAAKHGTGGAWEADVFYLPSTILDRDRPYYLRLAIVCDESGLVIGVEPSPPDRSNHQILADTICSTAQKRGVIPGTIFVKGPAEAAALAPLAKALGFATRRQKNLRAIAAFKKAAMDQWVQGRT
jgi:hypothetical protein